MASHVKRRDFSTDELVWMAQQAIARSRNALRDFRLVMQGVEERQTEIRCRRSSRLSLEKHRASLEKICQLPLGNLPDDPLIYELFLDADFAQSIRLASLKI
jgi:hypothetical protein